MFQQLLATANRPNQHVCLYNELLFQAETSSLYPDRSVFFHIHPVFHPERQSKHNDWSQWQHTTLFFVFCFFWVQTRLCTDTFHRDICHYEARARFGWSLKVNWATSHATLRHFSAHHRLSITSLPHSGQDWVWGDVAIDCGNDLYHSLKCKCVYQVGLWCRSRNAQWGTIVNQTFARRPIERAALTPQNETANWNKSSSDGQYKFPSLSCRAWKRVVLSDARQCRISKGTLISCSKLKSTDVLCQGTCWCTAAQCSCKPLVPWKHTVWRQEEQSCVFSSWLWKTPENWHNILMMTFPAPLKHWTCC